MYHRNSLYIYIRLSQNKLRLEESNYLVSTWQEMILKVLCLHEKNDNRDWLNKMTAKSLCSLHIDFSVLIFPSLLEHTYFTILNGTGKIWNADYDPKLIDVS